MIGAEDLNNRFTYHPPFADQASRYQLIRAHASELASFIDLHAPDSREKSLAITRIEEAVMWANAAIARNETPQAGLHDPVGDIGTPET